MNGHFETGEHYLLILEINDKNILNDLVMLAFAFDIEIRTEIDGQTDKSYFNSLRKMVSPKMHLGILLYMPNSYLSHSSMT